MENDGTIRTVLEYVKNAYDEVFLGDGTFHVHRLALRGFGASRGFSDLHFCVWGWDRGSWDG